MTVDRYTKLLLTIIALELGWIGASNMGVQVSAQRNEPTPVVIRGVEGRPRKRGLHSGDGGGLHGPQGRISDDRSRSLRRSPSRSKRTSRFPSKRGIEPLLIRTVSDPPARQTWCSARRVQAVTCSSVG